MDKDNEHYLGSPGRLTMMKIAMVAPSMIFILLTVWNSLIKLVE